MTDMDIIKDMNSKSSLFKQGFMFGLGVFDCIWNFYRNGYVR